MLHTKGFSLCKHCAGSSAHSRALLVTGESACASDVLAALKHSSIEPEMSCKVGSLSTVLASFTQMFAAAGL